jgi:glutamate/tyrosine decarboxylase-like PLP-dependent enzyme
MTEAQDLLLNLPADVRGRVWTAMVDGIEKYLNDVRDLGAGGPADDEAARSILGTLDFDAPIAPEDAIGLVLDALRTTQRHVSHPRYFGLFEAAPTTMGIVGETLAATFNACLATRAGSPFGVAAEERIVAAFAAHFGFPASRADGITTTGGSEANHTALLLALTSAFPSCAEQGLIGLEQRPIVYQSAETHPSVARAVRLSGLGARSVREIAVDGAFRIDLRAAETAIQEDLRAGHRPLMLVLNAGTSGTGSVDPLAEGARIAETYGLWLHVDAAWGGAAAILPEMRRVFDGLERADSITFDPHKWMSVPLGAGLLLTRHPGLLDRTFAVHAAFLDGACEVGARDPHARSMRWSRGFAGLKLLLSLAVAGWDGYRAALRKQIDLGDALRRELSDAGWRIRNDTPLPVVCFDADESAADHPRFLEFTAKAVNASGEARIFLVNLAGRPALRACVTNPATGAADVSALVARLGEARADVLSGRVDAAMLSQTTATEACTIHPPGPRPAPA